MASRGGIKLDSGSWKYLRTGVLLACTLQLVLASTALAQESRSSFGSILPQSGGDTGTFRARSPLGDMLNSPASGQSPADSFSMPSIGGGSPMAPASSFGASDPLSAPASDPNSSSSNYTEQRCTPAGDSVTAWYKFLEPSLNLARQLEAQRKKLLSIVPMPLDLRGAAAVKSENRLVLLRAEKSPDYACFKTIYGLLFARSGALVMVATGKNVRVMNLNGKEKDVLFQLTNGQVITVGPGSEMIISKNLDAHDVNVADSIARRGFTKPMKCNDLQMAFAQFLHSSLFAQPEMHYFLKTQNQTSVDALNSTVAKLNEIRGNTGFKVALTDDELKARRKDLSNTVNAGKTRVPLVALKPAKQPGANPTVAKDQKSPVQIAFEEQEAKRKENARKIAAEEKRKSAIGKAEAERRAASAKSEEEKRKLAEAKAIEEQRRIAIAKAKAEDAREKQEAIQRKLAKKKANTADVAAAAAAVRGDDSVQVDTTVASNEKSTARRILGSLPSMKRKDADALPKPVKAARPSSTSTASRPSANGPIKMILPRVVPTDDTPPEIAKLLLDALQEEKNARALRKKADKCMSFADCGMLSYEQQKKMLIEARQHLKDASEAEERCQALRKQAMTASSVTQTVH